MVGRGYGTTSRWMTLVPEERGMDHEFIGQVIRHVKRQLKRPFPKAFDTKPTERIFVLPQACGQLALKTKEVFRLPELPNLYLGNHALGGVGGALGSLEMAQLLETQLMGANAPRATNVIIQP